MTFDPKAYLQKKMAQAPSAPSGGFDPKAYLAKKAPAAQQTQEPNPIASAIRQSVSGFTAGGIDELQGIMEAGGKALGVDGLGGPVKNIKFPQEGSTADPETLQRAYLKAKLQERLTRDQDAKNPKAAFIGDMVGSIASPINKLAKGMSAAKAGLAVGGINGFLRSDADNAADLATDTAVSTVLGGATNVASNALAEKLAKVLPKKPILQGIRDYAVDRSASAQGATKAFRNKVGADRVYAVGEQGLDKGIVTPFATVNKMAERNSSLMNRSMAARGAVYNNLDEAGLQSMNPQELALKLEDSVGQTFNRQGQLPTEIAQEEQLQAMLKGIRAFGDKPLSFNAWQKNIEALSKEGNWDTARSTLKNQLAKHVYRGAREAFNESAEQVAGKQGPLVKKAIEETNSIYRVGSDAKKMLSNNLAAIQGNRQIGLTDTIVGGSALAKEGLENLGKVGMVLAAKKVADRFGNQWLATGANAVHKGANKSLQGIPDAIKNNPLLLQELLNQAEITPALQNKAKSIYED